MSDNNQRIQIGQPSLFFNRTSNICRGEVIPELWEVTRTQEIKLLSTK